MSSFGFIKCFQKNGVYAGRSTWRVRPWHGCGSEYLEDTAEELGKWSCMIDHGFSCSIKGVSPFPRDFDKNLVFKNVFQQRYRDVVLDAISTRENFLL
jgi:hypothetical protein